MEEEFWFISVFENILRDKIIDLILKSLFFQNKNKTTQLTQNYFVNWTYHLQTKGLHRVKRLNITKVSKE